MAASAATSAAGSVSTDSDGEVLASLVVDGGPDPADAPAGGAGAV